MSLVQFRNFDGKPEEPEEPAPEEILVRFTEEELEAAKKAAYDEGVRDGRAARAQEDYDALLERQVQALEALGPALVQLYESRATHRKALEAEATEFAMCIGRRVFPELIEGFAQDRAAAEISKALALVADSRTVTISLPPGSQTINGLIEDQVASLSLPGTVKIEADPQMTAGEARVTWQDGRMEMSLPSICDQILAILAERKAELTGDVAEKGDET